MSQNRPIALSFNDLRCRRERLSAPGTPCIGTKCDPALLGLDWVACQCSHRFYVTTAGVRTHTFRRAAIVTPSPKFNQIRTRGNRVFSVDTGLVVGFLAPFRAIRDPIRRVRALLRHIFRWPLVEVPPFRREWMALVDGSLLFVAAGFSHAVFFV